MALEKGSLRGTRVVRRIQGAIDETSENESNLTLVERLGSYPDRKEVNRKESQHAKQQQKNFSPSSGKQLETTKACSTDSHAGVMRPMSQPAQYYAKVVDAQQVESTHGRSRGNIIVSSKKLDITNVKETVQVASQHSAEHGNPRLTSPKQVPIDGNILQNQHHRQHASSCSVAKQQLVNAEVSPRLKQHQRHCIHHNPNCQKQQQQQQSHLVRVSNRLVEDNITSEALVSDSATRSKPVKYFSRQQDHGRQDNKSYLLVEYRPSIETDANNNRGQSYQYGTKHYHHQHHEPAVNTSNSKRTTIKFISQIYFLLHLSAILSLLLHHKNLVTSERKLAAQQQQQSPATDYDLHTTHSVVKKSAFNQSQQVIPMLPQPPQTTTTTINQLPVPLMLAQTNSWHQNNNNSHHNHRTTVNSVVVTQTTTTNSGSTSGVANNNRQQPSRFGRQTVATNYNGQLLPTTPLNDQPIVLGNSPDILVRLVGHWHAKCALQYFLCYLLSSSVTVLICLRLFRKCNWQHKKSGRHSRYKDTFSNDIKIKRSSSANQDSASYGFYYRTRLDCTPVLIGSISLGLIQLIVIGLDIANKVDWLGDSRWPIYLPFLQFAFVSLLMQYILGRVAKNKSSGGFEGRKNDGEKQVALSINDGKRSNNREILKSHHHHLEHSTSSYYSPIGNGVQNIALAHLLVTHILLWLMKLNSISLFQAIEQQQQQSFSSVVVGQPSLVTHNNNKLYPNHSSSSSSTTADTQSAATGPFSSTTIDNLYSQQQQKDLLLINNEQQHNRTELENILRRKLAPRLPESSMILPSQVTKALETPPQPVFNNKSLLDNKQRIDQRPASQAVQPTKNVHIGRTETTVNNTDYRETLNNLNEPVIRLSIHPAGGDVGSDSIGGSTSPPPPVSSDVIQLKNERGLRSATVARPNLSTSTQILVGPDSPSPKGNNLVELFKLGSFNNNERPLVSSSANSTSVTMSQAQLMNLLNIAAKNQHHFADVEQKQQHHQQPDVNISSNVFKSSLPKRMTAFRQTKSSSLPKNGPQSTTTTTTKPTTTSTTTPTSTTTSTTTSKAPSLNPKQRVRVLVNHEEGPMAEIIVASTPELDERKRRGGKPGKLADEPREISTTERPFPSVDSDPPDEAGATTPASFLRETLAAASRPAVASSSKNMKERSNTTEVLGKTTPTKTGVEIEKVVGTEPKVGGAESVGDDDLGDDESGASDSGGSGESEEPDIDLDALLPPVPNYNETNTDGDTNDDQSQQLQATSRKARVLLANEAVASVPDKGKALQEEAFVFNEAASVLNITMTPPTLWLIANQSEQNSTTIPTNTPNNHSKPIAPTKEALVMQQNGQQRSQYTTDSSGGQQQPTFADYLLPIVHQYHILIVAILFNMWLDSLRGNNGGTTSTTSNGNYGSLPANNGQQIGHRSRLLPFSRADLVSAASSSSEIGTISRSSSTKGLIAIPIRQNDGSKLARNHLTEPKYIAASTVSGGYALERVHRSSPRWRPLSERHKLHHRSRSMDSLHHHHHQNHRRHQHGNGGGSMNGGSSLSRCNSLRSSSSEKLLWIPHLRSRAKSPQKFANWPFHHQHSPATSTSSQSSSGDSYAMRAAVANKHWRRKANQDDQEEVEAAKAADVASNSVCSVFFGLLVVSTSLIVILLGIDLLSVLTQCFTQLISILVCLLGLCLTWRHQSRSSSSALSHSNNRRAAYLPGSRAAAVSFKQQSGGRTVVQLHYKQAAPVGSHRQCFHYLFLLAAYYCGISIALNLSKQHSVQQLFSQQVIQFIQRHLTTQSSTYSLFFPLSTVHSSNPLSFVNYLFLFHVVLALKGLLLIVQVTLQTVLIRSSCQRATRELRQIYTFLMFANLSLWAMEICEQQQHLQRDHNVMDIEQVAGKLVTLDSFTRFAASIVTLSHLYHGLVFMQH